MDRGLKMFKVLVSAAMVAAVAGCANSDYQKPTVESDITGFYSYTQSMLAATSVQTIQLNADGSGFTCNYSQGETGARVPIKHIGNGVWASSSVGTAKITKNSDGSVSWGSFTTYYPQDISNTNCK